VLVVVAASPGIKRFGTRYKLVGSMEKISNTGKHCRKVVRHGKIFYSDFHTYNVSMKSLTLLLH